MKIVMPISSICSPLPILHQWGTEFTSQLLHVLFVVDKSELGVGFSQGSSIFTDLKFHFNSFLYYHLIYFHPLSSFTPVVVHQVWSTSTLIYHRP